MNKIIQTLTVLLVSFCFSGYAHATLIGDTITVQNSTINCTTCFPFGDNIFGEEVVTVVEGAEELTDFRGFDIDIEESSIDITTIFILTGFASADFNGLMFLDLDWIGGIGAIVGVTLTTDVTGLDSNRVSFGADWVSLNQEGLDEWRSGEFAHLALTTSHGVPEPSTIALLSFGLAGLGFTRRRMKV